MRNALHTSDARVNLSCEVTNPHDHKRTLNHLQPTLLNPEPHAHTHLRMVACNCITAVSAALSSKAVLLHVTTIHPTK
jgi:hypothetical protein